MSNMSKELGLIVLSLKSLVVSYIAFTNSSGSLRDKFFYRIISTAF